ncbi:ribosomal RNA small subunit methyltransferase A [bacterium]|nr:ribosomal RNA small subunit methyltransferase A [bacterium]
MVRYKKSFGQHILSDHKIISKIISMVPVKNNQIVEVGPGTGNLTKHILDAKPASLIAIEKDTDMITVLEEKFPDNQILNLISSDFLKITPSELPEKFVFISNLPYYITTDILIKLCGLKERIISTVIMTQYEYFQRLNADPGTKQNSSISIFIKSFFDVIPGFKVKKGSFFPPPKIDSYVFSLVPNTISENISDFKFYNSIIRSSFSKRRKQMASVLSKESFVSNSKNEISEILVKMGFSGAARPEELAIEDFITLANDLKQQ